MSNEAAEATNCGCNAMSGMFDQAVKAFGDSLKAASKVQEDTMKFWTDTMGKTNPIQEWPRRAQAMVGELIPIAQKNADEYLKLVETNYRRNADLMKKAFNGSNGGGEKVDLQKRTRELWEASLEVARENAQDVASTNMRVAQMWTDAFKKNAESAAAEMQNSLGK